MPPKEPECVPVSRAPEVACAACCAGQSPHRVLRIEPCLVRPGLPPVSVIIPARRRDGSLLQALVAELGQQSLPPREVILVVGDSRQGRAINHGVSCSAAEFIVIMDDDTQLRGADLIERLVGALRAHPNLGLAGASTVLPERAGRLQRAAIRQIPRRLFPVVEELTDSDMVQHPCLALRRDLFLRIGGEDEDLIRGLDPILRRKVRDVGLRVAIAPHAAVSHPLPERLGPLLGLYFRNGRGSAFAQRHYPERVLDLGTGFEGAWLPARRALARRALAYPGRLLGSLITLRWLRLLTDCAYLLGWGCEILHGSPRGAAARRDGGAPPGHRHLEACRFRG